MVFGLALFPVSATWRDLHLLPPVTTFAPLLQMQVWLQFAHLHFQSLTGILCTNLHHPLICPTSGGRFSSFQLGATMHNATKNSAVHAFWHTNTRSSLQHACWVKGLPRITFSKSGSVSKCSHKTLPFEAMRIPLIHINRLSSLTSGNQVSVTVN